MGFEPTRRFYAPNGLANRRLQPLGHPSKPGVPGGIRTRDLQIRNLEVYPAELRKRK
jgi:hypothetical protein